MMADLDAAHIAKAHALTFSPASVDWLNLGYANEAMFYDWNSFPDTVFSWTGKAGSTYDLYAYSYFDPDFLWVFDNLGNLIVKDTTSTGDVYGYDYINGFVTPYSGIYYVFAAWEQGSASANKLVLLKILEKAADTTAPIVATFNPVDEATGVAIGSNIVVTFSESIAKGVGSIVLKAAGAVVATYDAATNSSNLTISGSTLTINPTADLSNSTAYTVEFAAGSIKDLANNSYAGTTSYNFKTIGSDLMGTPGNDSFTTSSGNDIIDGGGGIDTVIFSGTRASHTITKTAKGWTVSSTADGTDTLQNVDRLQFSNETLALDINGAAGQAYRIYQAAFNRTPDNGGLKYWIGRMDAGTTQDRVAAEFIGSQEFKDLYGTNPSNADYLTKLYSNVLHRTPDAGGYNWWLGELDAGRYDKTSALASFAESTENQAGVIGVIQNGIDLFN